MVGFNEPKYVLLLDQVLEKGVVQFAVLKTIYISKNAVYIPRLYRKFQNVHSSTEKPYVIVRIL